MPYLCMDGHIYVHLSSAWVLHLPVHVCANRHSIVTGDKHSHWDVLACGGEPVRVCGEEGVVGYVGVWMSVCVYHAHMYTECNL